MFHILVERRGHEVYTNVARNKKKRNPSNMRNVIFILFSLALVSCKDHSEERYYQIKNAYHIELNELKNDFLEAVTEEEKMALMEKMPDGEAYIESVYNLVSVNRNSNYAIDAWVELFNSTWYKNDSIFDMTIDALTDKHTKNEDLVSILPMALSKNSNPKTEEFIEKVLKENSNQKIKGIFTLALAQKYTQRKDSKFYNLDKGLELFNTLKQNYSSIEIEYGDDQKLTKLGTIADNAIFSLTAMSIGSKMPEVTSTDLKGNEVKLSDYLGNVIVLDVWATWCGPCIKMIPHQTKMVEKLKDKPFQLISISLDEKVSTINKFQEKTKMPWINWHNGKTGGVIDDWGITQYPTILIVDRKGIIRHRSNGAMKGEELDSIVNDLLSAD